MEQVMKVDNMGSYSEQIVKRKMSSTTITSLILSLGLILLLIALSIYLSGYFNWLVPVALLLSMNIHSLSVK